MKETENIWEKVFRRNGEIVTRVIAGEMFLVPIKGKLADMQRIFSLNAAGEYIWEHLDGKRALREIREGVLGSFEADTEDVEEDLREFVAALLREELITGADA